MSLDLALTLSFEGISLLTRVPGGWHLLGEVTLDSEDLAGDLTQLRQLAIDVAGPDFGTMLVLPNDQIKYLSLPEGRMSDKRRRAKATEALEANTPYTMDQLIFDLHVSGKTPQVAAVARETLQEATTFATEHAFNPLRFTAIPPAEDFDKAPDFGLSDAARAGVHVAADPVRIQVIGHGPLERPLERPDASADHDSQGRAESVSTEQGAVGDAAALTEQNAAPIDAPMQQDLFPQAEAEAAQHEATTDPKPVEQPEDGQPENVALQPDAQTPKETEHFQLENPLPTETLAETDAAPPQEPLEAAPAFASMRAQKDVTPASQAKSLGGASRDVTGTNAPRIPSDSGAADFNALRFDPAKAVAGLQVDAHTDLDTREDAGDAADAGTFSSNRSKTRIAPAAPTLKGAMAEPGQAGRKGRKRTDAVEKQNMTVFGSRQHSIGGKPRHLGLILTFVLLAFLGAIAVWASFFAEDGVAGLFGGDKAETQIATAPDAILQPSTQPATETTSQTSAQPNGVSDEQLDGRIDTPLQAGTGEVTPDAAPTTQDATLADPLEEDTAALLEVEADTQAELVAQDDDLQTALLAPSDTNSLTDSAEVEMMEDQGDLGALSQQDAEARYAVTGIWQRAPQPPADLLSDSSDDIYIASIDRNHTAFDAVALPAIPNLTTDLLPQRQLSPVAANAQFDFDERGLVVASTDGTLNPEGVMVYLGRPAPLPPRYPDRSVAEAQLLSPSNTVQLALSRPRLRPADLLEQNQRATLGGLTLDELAKIRPQLRPLSDKQVAEADTTPTKYAVKTSLRPRAKPANIAQLAQRATASQSVASVVAVPASATIVPDIPTTASVARQATIKDAINLHKVNLIGVYGTSSNRRALVRLSNGRYKKVQVGDRIDGGKVAAIGQDELRYLKSGKNVTLKMPKG